MPGVLSYSSFKYAGFFLIEQWGKSCALFKSSELSKLAFISVNAFMNTVKLLFSVGWYFLLIPLLQAWLLIQGKNWFAGATFLLWAYVLILLLRPSVRKKRVGYFLRYVQHVWGFLIVTGIMLSVCVKLPEMFLNVLEFVIAPWLFWLMMCIALPPTLFSGFLFIDTELDLFPVFYKGLLMFACTLPFCVVFSIFLFFPMGIMSYYLISVITGVVPFWLVKGITVLLLNLIFLAQAALFNSVYLKVIYENIELYIPHES